MRRSAYRGRPEVGGACQNGAFDRCCRKSVGFRQIHQTESVGRRKRFQPDRSSTHFVGLIASAADHLAAEWKSKPPTGSGRDRQGLRMDGLRLGGRMEDLGVTPRTRAAVDSTAINRATMLARSRIKEDSRQWKKEARLRPEKARRSAFAPG